MFEKQARGNTKVQEMPNEEYIAESGECKKKNNTNTLQSHLRVSNPNYFTWNHFVVQLTFTL